VGEGQRQLIKIPFEARDLVKFSEPDFKQSNGLIVLPL
jgi:hypothetical protein